MASHNFGHSIDQCLFFPQLQQAIILFLFFSFFPPLHFRQLNCYNSFFFFSSSFGKPHSFFSSPLYFWQLNCHNFFFLSPQFWQLDCLNSFFSLSSLLQFQQLYCHNCFFFFSLSPHSSQAACILGRNLNNYITKIQLSLSLSLSLSITSFLFPLSYSSQNCGDIIVEICLSLLIFSNKFKQCLYYKSTSFFTILSQKTWYKIQMKILT